MNMMRLAFAGAAAGGCALMGMGMARRLVRREEAIAAWSRLLDGLAAQLSYVDDPLPDVLSRLTVSDAPGDARLSSVIEEAVDNMCRDRTLSFSDALDTERAFADMDASDAATLLPLVRELGTTARPQQTARLDSARASLASMAARAADMTARQKRLYVSLGLLGGLALFICLVG
ncbi:MAG: stage III sporulation protein AB [Oscillospiraceae bacterium]|jgi:stage III sporulation protein AB|nr:stage III sporulation protein AB [Oscillospiraceae bacterium]